MKNIMKYFLLLCFFVCTFLLALNIEYTEAAEVFPFNGIIQADSLVVYDTNTSSKSQITQLAYGTRIKVLGTAPNSGTCPLYQIEYEDGKIGYVCYKSKATSTDEYVVNVDTHTLTTDQAGLETYKAYCQTMGNNGFPESYCPYLYYLHVKHPNWIFKANKVNKTLDEASKGEEYKCALQTGNKNYWLSEKPAESNYYYVKANVIASFMDPRNSLFENTIFQFLDSDDTKDLVSDKTLNYIVGDGNLKQFLDTFKKAASEQGINVVQLVARSKQEGNNKVGYKPTTGTYSTDTGNLYKDKYSLDGYYNYYNINATGTYVHVNSLAYAAGFTVNEKCIVIKKAGSDNEDKDKDEGENAEVIEPEVTEEPASENRTIIDTDKMTKLELAYYDETIEGCGPLTYQRPWNTAEKAIVGGADFLATKYIRKGQDTNYYQKFNVSPIDSSKMYTNQYMENIYAPASEGKQMMSTYSNSGELDLAFVFSIPVFNGTGEIYQPVDKSSNNYLSSLMVEDKLITGFDKNVLEYSHNISTSNSSVRISAKTEDAKAKVTGTGSVNFVDGVAKASVVVTAEDGSKRTYNLTIKQVIPVKNVKVSDIIAKMAVKVDGNYMYGISPGESVTTIISTVTKNNGTAVVTDVAGKNKTTGSFKTGDKLVIKGTTESKTYVIIVRGDINGDGEIDLRDFVLTQSHILQKNELKDEKFKAGDVNYDNNIDLKDFVLIQSHILKKNNL